MSESFGGEGRFYEESCFRAERNPDIETREQLQEVDKILAKIVETGAELSTDVKQGLRNQLQTRLHALGLDDIDGLTAIREHLRERRNNPQVPFNFPSKDKFRTNLNLTMNASPKEWLPNMYIDPLASEIAQYGHADWRRLQGRGGTKLDDYLYKLAAIMSDEFIYTDVFDETDVIVVDDNWHIANGRHRSLALKVLGDSFVYDSGIDNWVQVEIED